MKIQRRRQKHKSLPAIILIFFCFQKKKKTSGEQKEYIGNGTNCHLWSPLVKLSEVALGKWKNQLHVGLGI